MKEGLNSSNLVNDGDNFKLTLLTLSGDFLGLLNGPSLHLRILLLLPSDTSKKTELSDMYALARSFTERLSPSADLLRGPETSLLQV